jgi:maleylacetate reductase
VVALGGGRVIDAAKAIGGADGVSVAAVPTTLSGAPFSRIHRLPEGAEGTLVRPSLVIIEPGLMASQPMPGLAASAMNALAHATESLYVPLANPIAEIAALRAAALFSSALAPDEPVRPDLALAATLASWAMGTTGYAFHHPVCQTLVRNPGTPHAETNAVMLAHSIDFARSRAPEQIGKLEEALGRDVRDLTSRAGPATLGELGVREEHVEPVVQAVKDRRELANTPGGRPTEDELRALIRGAL